MDGRITLNIKSLQRVESIISALVPEGYKVTAMPKYEEFWKDKIDYYVVEINSKGGRQNG